MLSSCASHQTKTGQRFYEDSPSFYLSIAPSFSVPKEYEVVENSLILRTYSGAGGYNWGKRKEQLRKTLTTVQEKEIRKLAVAAVKESTEEDQAGLLSLFILTPINFLDISLAHKNCLVDYL